MFFLAACATSIPAGTTFDPTSGDALVIVDETLAGRGNSLILEGVDLEGRTFNGPRRLISMANRNRIEGGAAGMDLYLGTVPPGVYAVAGHETVSLAGRATRCYRLGAIVVDMRAGQGNLISRNRLRFRDDDVPASGADDAAVFDIALQSARQVLAGVPAIASEVPVERAEIAAQIRWSQETTMEGVLVGETCPEARNFEIMPDPAASPGAVSKPE
ncbi:MAG: hypothetical protein GYB36_04845 [Alphaproteobacteria bacterium]|nr:hypothetical protein [Alphaproteobacteria bacterium]